MHCGDPHTMPELDTHNSLWYLDTTTPEEGDLVKAMTLRLNDTEYERLRTVAYVEDRAMTAVIREAIHEYMQSRASHSEFRDALERAMEENAKLIADLANP